MKKRAILASAGLFAALVTFAVLPETAALAHAEKEVGPYTVAIGLGTEPAYVGFPNSVEVIIHETSTGKGIDSAADTLKATIGFGSATMPVTLEPNFDEDSGGSPGDYRGAFVPTQPGDYTIHVEGTINTTAIDETIAASPTTFDSVTDLSAIEFPTKVPTVTELSQKLDRGLARSQAQAAAQAKDAKDAADSARTLAIVGIAVGGLGLILGAVALARGRRKTAP